MGLLDGLAGGGGNGPGVSQGGGLGAITDLIQSQGGLGGLLGKLNQGGLGGAAGSWVSNGPNQAVTPGGLQGALGGGVVEAFARKLGLPPAAASAALAVLLPQVINHLTPHGQVPPQEPGDLMGQLGGMFGQHR